METLDICSDENSIPKCSLFFCAAIWLQLMSTPLDVLRNGIEGTQGIASCRDGILAKGCAMRIHSVASSTQQDPLSLIIALVITMNDKDTLHSVKDLAVTMHDRVSDALLIERSKNRKHIYFFTSKLITC